MKSAALIMFDNVEELEAVAPLDILRRAGAEVVSASLSENTRVVGRSRIQITCDALFRDIKDRDFDAVILAGGPGTNEAAKNAGLLNFIARHNARGALIAAICAAPVVLKAAGVLGGKKCTAHTSRAAELDNCDCSKPVVADANIITSRGAGTAVEFGLEIAEKIFSAEVAKEVAYSICFMR